MRIPKSYPLAFGMFFSTFKTSFSDLLVQTTVEKRDTIDWRRNAAFASFGCFYLGGVQYLLYVPVFKRFFPTAGEFSGLTIKQKLNNPRGMKETAAQVGLDQFVHHPLLYFPVFYATKEIVTNPTSPDLKRAIVKDYFGTNFKEDMVALWKIWIPSTVLNFTFMPLWGRIPWVASTSLIWTCILSMMRGGDDPIKGEVIGPGVSGVSDSLMVGTYRPRTCPVEMDSHLSHINVSATGVDKVGMVARMCKGVSDAGGNITMSKMTRLGNHFVMMMHVSYDQEKVRHLDLLESIRNNAEELVVKINKLQPRSTGLRKNADQMTFKVSCRGPDTPGFTAAITEVLARHSVSIENLDTNVVLEPDGSRSFWLDIEGTERKMGLFTDEDVQELDKDLKAVKNKEGNPLSRVSLKVAKKETDV